MPHRALLTKGLKGHKASARSKGPGSATDGFTSFSGVVSSELPEGWQLRRLGEIVERPQYGLTASATDEPKGPRFLRITDIQESGVAWRTVPYCECDADSVERLRLRPGDVVVARIGATTGKAYLIRDQVDAVFASYLIRLRATDRLVPDFLAFFTNSAYYWRQIDSVKGGRLKQGINIPLLESLEIPLPPLAEQRAIVEVLRTVQRAKEATEKVIAATRQLKASLMKHLFTYGPVPLDRADREDLKDTEIGSVADRWGVIRLGDVLASGGGSIQTGPFGSQLHASDYVEDGTPVVMPKDLSSNGKLLSKNVARINQEDCARLARHRLEPGDLLVARRGELGRRGLVTEQESGWLCGTGCFRVRPGAMLHPPYLSALFETEVVRAKLVSDAIGTTMANLNTQILNFLPIPVPSILEQHEIANRLSAVDAKLTAEERRRAALDALFKSLLHHLMMGKVRIGDIAS